MLTRQEIFDKAWLGLKAQGFKQSIAEETTEYGRQCQYRGDGGRRCAIGFCIPDEEYSPEMEGYGADAHIVARVIGEENGEFADALQECHDYAQSPDGMKQRLREFAAEHGLTIPDEQPATA